MRRQMEVVKHTIFMDNENISANPRVLALAAEGVDLGVAGDFAAVLGSVDCRSAGVVDSAQAALEIASDLSRRPDVLVADLGSASEQFDVCALAGQLREGFAIPVLFTMNRTDLGRMNEAIAARPAGYLNKPFSADTLRSAIIGALPKPAPKPALRTGAGLPEISDSHLPPLPFADGESDTDSADDERENREEATSLPPLPAPELKTAEPKVPQELSASSDADGNDKRTARGQQLQGLGYLGRGFAHEFNNLLTVLIGNLSLAQDRYEGSVSGNLNEIGDSEISTALAAAEKARRMVQQLMTFAEGGRPVRDVVRIADLARIVLMPHREAHPAIRFQFQCSEPDLKVSVDRDQIFRLLENLVTNAVQAMPDGGTAIVRLFTTTDTEIDRVRPGAGQSGLEYLLIEVIDTGCGMDEQTLQHAFDPYFTTRGENNATGIGLTVCESIAKAHGGFLVLQSKPGRGTIATFHLPMNAATARPDIFQLQNSDAGDVAPPVLRDEGEGIPGLFSSLPDSELDAPASNAGLMSDADISDENIGEGVRVLVMEDDAMIRRLVARCLGRAGYEVVESVNGQEALDAHQLARSEGRPYDLILSDLTIEDGMGGIEMMSELRRRDPAIRAIVSSGYADSPAMARPQEYGFDAVLPKPYPPRELLRAVASTLSGDGVGR